jgi:Ca-activated chloride channel family protein
MIAVEPTGVQAMAARTTSRVMPRFARLKRTPLEATMRFMATRRTVRVYSFPAIAALVLAGCTAGALGNKDADTTLTDRTGKQAEETEGNGRSTLDARASNVPDAALAPPASVIGLSVVATGAHAAGDDRFVDRFRRTGASELRAAADPEFNTEGYAGFDDNPFLAVTGNPLSTFSIDVDRASYANVRRFLRDGRLPPKDAVRIEELVNYFTFDDPAPSADSPFAVTTELGDSPWRPGHLLLRIGLQATAVETGNMPASNLVFLMDVSGSMNSPDKLPLLKQAFGLLVNELGSGDRVAIVVYAGAAGIVLESTPGDRKEQIISAIERLEAGGSTAGGAGIRLAYDVAQRNHIEGGNNRVILATDGDFNIGASSDAEMMRLIEEKRAQGTFLTVLGFGTGNLKDSKMETLADHGNGNYAYIDGIAEARKVLVHEMGGTLVAVAKDVKLQIEFNPSKVRAYRLIGYENRLLAAEDFNDDTKDAGELGAGHSVTALYEIVPVGAETDVEIRGTDPLRYVTGGERAADSGELAFVKVRYKAPDGERSQLLEVGVEGRTTTSSADLTFAAAVASFGMLLRESPHSGNATFDTVLALARDGIGRDVGGYRAGFLELVETARTLATNVAAR